jgi:hypothetical protein
MPGRRRLGGGGKLASAFDSHPFSALSLMNFPVALPM